MQEQELEATATTYTALVSAYCKSDDLDAALEVCLMLCSGRTQSCICTQHMGRKTQSSSTPQEVNALDAPDFMPMALHCLHPLYLPCPFCLSHSVMHRYDPVHNLM